MNVGVRSWVFLACIVTLLTIVVYNHLYAASNPEKPNVHSINFKGETENKFKTNESVYIEGRNFKPSTNVDVYVTNNRKWVKR